MKRSLKRMLAAAIPMPPKQAADKVHPPRSGMQLRASHRGGCARTMRPHPRRPHGGRLPLAHTLTTFSYGIRRGFGRGGYRVFWSTLGAFWYGAG